MTRYLLDSNIYLNFYERYYQLNVFPTFWSSFVPIINAYVDIPKIVLEENHQSPWFSEWVNVNYKLPVINHKTYVAEWGNIMNHIHLHDCYKDSALSSDRGWGNEKIADPWIIAIAQKENLTIVTDEKKNPNLSNINPSKAAKIPDVCADLGIRCITMNQFFQEIQLVI